MTYDVIVIGGGPAGLSGAVALGRALRSVLVIDSGAPRNAPAAGIHNYLTRDGMSPADFLAAGRADVLRYGGTFVDGAVAAVSPGFVVTLADGREFSGRRLLITTGLVDVLPSIPGLAERWGRTVLHCPYCHGYEVQGKAIGVIATSDRASEQARLWGQWSSDVQVFPASSAAAIEDGGVRLTDGSFVARDYFVVAGRMEARAGFLTGLGLAPVEHPMGVGTMVPRSTRPGVPPCPGCGWPATSPTRWPR